MGDNRQDRRSRTDQSIDCRPFSLVYETDQSEGVLRNFSDDGAYVELPRPYYKGNVLMLRLLDEQGAAAAGEGGACRSHCLAEVKWARPLEDDSDPPRYGIGLKILP